MICSANNITSYHRVEEEKKPNPIIWSYNAHKKRIQKGLNYIQEQGLCGSDDEDHVEEDRVQ